MKRLCEDCNSDKHVEGSEFCSVSYPENTDADPVVQDNVGIKLIEAFLAEENMVKEYIQKQDKFEKIATKVRDYFQAELQELLNAYKNNPTTTPEEYYRLSVGLRDRCPDHVQKCFMADAIRQAFRGTGLIKSGLVV